MAVPALFGSEFRVNTSTIGNQEASSVTALANGKFFATWTDDNGTPADTTAKGQIFNADGSKSGGELTVADGTAHQRAPVVAALADGRFVLAWEDDNPTPGVGDGSGSAIRAQIFNIDGTPDAPAFVVNNLGTNSQNQPAIAALATGGFVVSWTTNVAGDFDIAARAYGANGVALGNQFGVDASNVGETQSTVTGLKDGSYAIAWRDAGSMGETDGSGSHMRGHVYSGNGVDESGGEFILNTVAANDQHDGKLVALSDGTFVGVWSSDDAGVNIRMRHFHADGTPFSMLDTAVDNEAATETFAAVAATDTGYIVAWTDFGSPNETDGSGTHVRVRLYNNDGTAASDEFIANTGITAGNQSSPVIAKLADGRFAVTWTDQGSDPNGGDTSGNGLRGAIFDPRTAAVHLTGSGFADDFIGTKFNDTMAGGLGNDHLVGAAGNDGLTGDVGNDALLGGDGADTLKGDPGNDSLEGGVGVDALAGGDGNDALAGGADGDALSGDAGADTADGGAGADRVSGGAGGDTLHGGSEDDKVSGGKGADRLFGDAGEDKLKGGSGGDRLVGGSGADKLYAGAGDSRDTFVFAKGDSGHGKPKSWDKIFGFDAHAKHEKVSDAIDLSALNVKWGDIHFDHHGKAMEVAIDYKGGHKADMIVDVMKVDELHQADFIL